MKNFKKVLLVVGVILITMISLVGCREMTKCRSCGRTKFCNEIGIDGEAVMMCKECEENMTSNVR